MSPGQLRRRVLTLLGKPREPWEIAICASTIQHPVTAQQVLSTLVNLEQEERAKQVGDKWERIAAVQQYQRANSAFNWRP